MMDRQPGKDRMECCIHGIVSVALFALLFFATFHSRAGRGGTLERQIIAFGDSVFGEVRDETAVPARVGELTGMSVYNAAFGGSCLARTEAERRLDYAKNSLSLTGLAKAVWSGDFGVQQALKLRESNTEYFAEVIDGLETVDFSQTEVVLIQQGINDYHAGTLIENPDDPYDEYTFLGALRSSVEALRKVNPELRIVLVTPTYTWYTYTGLTCEEADQGGGVLEAYVEAEIRAGEALGIEVIDVYHDFFPHESWEDMGTYMADGLHPNAKGREKLAERIAEVLRNPAFLEGDGGN